MRNNSNNNNLLQPPTTTTYNHLQPPTNLSNPMTLITCYTTDFREDFQKPCITTIDVDPHGD
eukprot:m.156384 g.156384  ORF g.156384 m.156384 type:complete len:62 (-) comp14322_c0_seq11:945-1130(-)